MLRVIPAVMLMYLCSVHCSVPLKQWKCGFQEAFQLRSISDWLREIAAVFAESRFFHDIHAYVTAERDVSVVNNSDILKSEPATQRLTACYRDNDSKVSCISNVLNSECPAMQSCSLTASDVQLTANVVSQYIEDSIAGNNVSVSKADGVTVNKDSSVVSGATAAICKQQKSTSPRKKTRYKLASEVKQVRSRRESRKTSNEVLPEIKVDEALTAGSGNSAGNTRAMFIVYS